MRNNKDFEGEENETCTSTNEHENRHTKKS